MSPEKDELDREIDAVLASLLKEEPQRVNARSVRQALDAARPVRWPLWLAAAAVLVAGLATALLNRRPVEVAPAQAAMSIATPEPSRREPSPEPLVRSSAVSRPAARSQTSRPRAPLEPDPGLPRLVIATLERPEPLNTALIEADAIVIPLIDISPLEVPTLSTESEIHQENPKP